MTLKESLRLLEIQKPFKDSQILKELYHPAFKCLLIFTMFEMFCADKKLSKMTTVEKAT